ncbi:MAG: hypothetical protein CMG91_04815 [Marinobacter sp.]|nr:hypothetical protein [Legionellales bacterium]MBI46717.1 hypothetical protein [Marinobacter sp.]MBI46777.1 hypothetical protein [Marinobacter sp.]|tara:strand:- start:60 stop:365 length:306 start_codon:yes stop_codon:yes gene_type:complete
MAMTPTERKRRQRERNKFLDMKLFTMELAANERAAIEEAARLREFDDQTEYILALVYKDRDMSRKENVCSYPDCNCPFDMGPDGKCLVGKPRKGEVEHESN